MIHRLTFRQQQQLTLISFVIAPLLTALPIAFVAIRGFAIDRAFQQLEIVAELRTTTIENWLADGEDIAQVVSNYVAGEVLHWAEEDQVPSDLRLVLDDAHQLDFFATLVDAYETISSISIIHPETGEILVSTDPILIGRIRINEAHFIEGQESFFAGQIRYSIGREAPVLFMSVPIQVAGVSGNFAIAEIELNVADLARTMSRGSGLGETGDAYVVEAFGYYVTPSRFLATGVMGVQADSVAAERLLQGESGRDQYYNSDGRQVLGVYHWLPEMQLGLIVEITRAEIFAQYQVLGVFLLVMGGLLLICGVWSARYFSARLIAPLQQVVITTTAFSPENLDQRVPVRGPVEIQQLALSFNEMAEKLQASYENLEVLILQRTESLGELQRLSQRFQLATEVSQLGIWDWDLQTLIMKWDDRMLEIYGITREQFSNDNTTWETSIHPDDYPESRQKFNKALEAGSSVNDEFRIVLPNRTVRYIRSQATFLYEKDMVARVVGVNLDITDMKQAEFTLRQALAAEQEFSQLKTRIVSTASHEFRTPLTSISSVAQTVIRYFDRIDKEGILERMHKVVDQTEYLTSITEDMLQYARLQEGTHRIAMELGDLVAFGQHLVDEFSTQVKYTGRIEFLAPTKPIDMMFDKKLMRQALGNLISNALKYSGPNEPVKIEFLKQDDSVLIRIQDKGIGIPQADIHRLFSPFHRASNVGAISGTGLGLSITQQAVETHSGTIRVQSEVGKGSLFSIVLPIK